MAVNAEPTRALSNGIVVRIVMITKVIAPAAILSGSQVLIADEDLIKLSLEMFKSLPIYWLQLTRRNHCWYEMTAYLLGEDYHQF